MILGFCNIFDEIFLEIFSNNGKKIKQKIIKKNKENLYPDLILEIYIFLEEQKINLKEITKVFLVPGPGKFTPARTATIFANFLATENNVKIFSVSKQEFKSAKTFTNFLNLEKKYLKKIDPIFSGPPKINQN